MKSFKAEVSSVNHSSEQNETSNARNLSIEILYGGNSHSVDKKNYLVIPPVDAAPQFL